MTATPGNDVLRWVIASSSLEVRCRGGVCPESWAALYPGFAARATARWSPDILVEVEPVRGWENPREIARGESAWWSTPTPDGVRLEWDDFRCVVRSEGSLLRGDAVADGAGASSLVGVIRSVLGYALVGRGMLLHASGVWRKGRLWLFCGYAGAGKTTVARELNGGGEPFCVDRAVVLRQGDAPRAYPTPFSDPQSELGAPEPGRPEAVVVLEQGDRHELRRLSVASAATRLVHHSAWNWKSVDVMDTALQTAAWVAERVPVYTLTFTRDEGFWALLDRATATRLIEGESDD